MSDEGKTEVRVNKRIGREKELKKKIKAAIDRYETVFGKPLSAGALKEFCDYCEKENRMVFLRDRIGRLSDVDSTFIRGLLKETAASNEVQPRIDTEDLEEVDDEDLVDEDDLGDEKDFLDT